MKAQEYVGAVAIVKGDTKDLTLYEGHKTLIQNFELGNFFQYRQIMCARIILEWLLLKYYVIRIVMSWLKK